MAKYSGTVQMTLEVDTNANSLSDAIDNILNNLSLPEGTQIIFRLGKQ